MQQVANKLMDNYLSWLRDRTLIRHLKDWVEITTPFLDRHNDHIQLYVKRDGDKFLLTDDGYTLADLEQSGCSLKTEKRAALLNATLNGFGVQFHDDRLEVTADEFNFPFRKHSLVQAILSVNDLFYLAEATISSIFHEDVAAWLDHNDIRYSPDISLIGKTGYSHSFNFLIPKSKNSPERIMQAINSPSKSNAESLAFRWLDTREARMPETQAYAILNDRDHTIPEGVITALARYEISVIPWSNREKTVETLAS